MVYVLFASVVGVVVVPGLLVLSFRPKQKRTAIFTEKNYALKATTMNEIGKIEDGSGFRDVSLQTVYRALSYSGVYMILGSGDFEANVIFTDSEGVRNVVLAKRITLAILWVSVLIRSSHTCGTTKLRELF
ncbi:hypothetical protein [Paenibacillus xylanexedens]|nr:hypothetical protein [Paenibacillus xylanexedens]